jgi:DNA-binding IclR family transcriptional regulator
VSRSRLPGQVRKLLETAVDSIEKVELIRHLRSAAAPVPRAEIARMLDLDREAADTLIAELAHAGLVEIVGMRGAVQAGAAAADEACADLLRIYDEDRTQIVTVLSTLALQRIRDMAAWTFGEALVSKKKPKDDT